VSYNELVKAGWRIVHTLDDRLYLMSPVQPVDSKRRRLELTLEHEILTVKNISSVVPGIVPQPSWLETTAVYTYSTDPMPPVVCPPVTASHAFAVYSTSFADSVPAPSAAYAGADPEQCVKHRADADQLVAADFPAVPEPVKMSTCDVNEVPVRSVISSDYAIEARVLREPISPTEISSTATVTYPECMVTPNTAERFLPVSNVAVAAVHHSHSENFRLLVRLLAAHDDPNECAAAHASCSIPQRVRHCATTDVAPIPVSLMDTSVPPGPPAMEATVHHTPSVRYFSAAAIDFAVTDALNRKHQTATIQVGAF
jgi:hypothetical protein